MGGKLRSRKGGGKKSNGRLAAVHYVALGCTFTPDRGGEIKQGERRRGGLLQGRSVLLPVMSKVQQYTEFQCPNIRASCRSPA